MNPITSPLTPEHKAATVEVLQAGLVDMINLGLFAKQLHWVIQGPLFLPVHLKLDEIADFAREYGDTLAERCVAVGGTPDGQASTVAAAAGVRVPDGPLADTVALTLMTNRLLALAETFRSRMAVTGQQDPVSQNLVISILEDIEKQHWMFQAMQPPMVR